MPPTLLRTLRIANTPVNPGPVHEAADQLDKIVVAKAGHDEAEVEQGCHHPWVPEAERRGVEAVRAPIGLAT